MGVAVGCGALAGVVGRGVATGTPGWVAGTFGVTVGWRTGADVALVSALVLGPREAEGLAESGHWPTALPWAVPFPCGSAQVCLPTGLVVLVFAGCTGVTRGEAPPGPAGVPRVVEAGTASLGRGLEGELGVGLALGLAVSWHWPVALPAEVP